MIFLLAAAALLAGAPLIASVLVSVASVREDAAKSLAGIPPGLLARAVRRLLQASVGGSGQLQSLRGVTGPATGGRPRWQPQRSSRAAQIPAPRWPADDDAAARAPDALATPRS